MIRFILLFFCIISIQGYTQIIGNQQYLNQGRNDNYYTQRTYNSLKTIQSTDSTLTINVNVLLTQAADRYVLTLGVIQSDKSSALALEGVNRTIENFITQAKRIGIAEKDIYVDYISQTKVYDFLETQDSKSVTQVEDGFEVRKNILISINDLATIEKVIEVASNNSIYNIIGVEYINDDLEKIHSILTQEAFKIASKKANEYAIRTNTSISKSPRLEEIIYSSHPSENYKGFTAYESADHSYSYKTKYIQRKEKTVFYQGINHSGFDKVINNKSPQVGIQYVIMLSATYNTKSK